MDYVIGDIHGCLEQLESLIAVLRKEGLNPNDSLIFVGDYIDRGSNSKEVIDFLLSLSQEFDCTFLAGNHEEMFLDWLGVKDLTGARNGKWFIHNGGEQTLASYGLDMEKIRTGSQELRARAKEEGLPPPRSAHQYLFPETHLEFLRELDIFSVIDDRVVIVHAGLSWAGHQATSVNEAIEATSVEDALWIRGIGSTQNHFGGTIVYGHTPHKSGVQWFQRGANQAPFSVGIDTGCVFGLNPLVALRLEDWKIFSAGGEVKDYRKK